MRTVILSMAIGLWTATAAMAADCCAAPDCCGQTGGCCDQAQGCCCRCGAKKVCKVVRETKKIKKNVWVVECEEFCAPLPRCAPCCKADCGCCESSCCEDACCNDPCAPLRNRCLVPPKCGKVRCRKKLVRKEVTCEVPVYKCVVVCCAGCCGKADGEPASEGEKEAQPEEATTGVAPLPPVLGTSYLKALQSRP